MTERANCHEHDQHFWADDGCQVCNVIAERDALCARLAEMEGKVGALRDFVEDFAKAKIDALRYSPPHGSSPEDEPDPVVDAETVWAWQSDAKDALAAAGCDA